MVVQYAHERISADEDRKSIQAKRTCPQTFRRALLVHNPLAPRAGLHDVGGDSALGEEHNAVLTHMGPRPHEIA